MPINFSEDFRTHDVRNKCGVITQAKIEHGDKRLQIGGYLYGRDFPQVINALRNSDKFGFSFDAADCHVEDMAADVWRITKLTFFGATLIRKDKAAYQGTSIRLMKKEEAI